MPLNISLYISVPLKQDQPYPTFINQLKLVNLFIHLNTFVKLFLVSFLKEYYFGKKLSIAFE